MTQIAASGKTNGALADRVRTVVVWLTIALIAFAAGAYVFAPAQHRSRPTNLPVSWTALPTGVVTLEREDGGTVLLPVRIADTSSARLTGFRDVGEDALANQFLLYAQSRQTSARISYSLEKVRVPLELAVIDGDGNVLEVQTSTAGQERITVAQPHRWVLAAKAGTFTHYGIEPGLRLDPEAVRKINL